MSKKKAAPAEITTPEYVAERARIALEDILAKGVNVVLIAYDSPSKRGYAAIPNAPCVAEALIEGCHEIAFPEYKKDEFNVNDY